MKWIKKLDHLSRDILIVSDGCFTPSQEFFSYIMADTLIKALQTLKESASTLSPNSKFHR